MVGHDFKDTAGGVELLFTTASSNFNLALLKGRQHAGVIGKDLEAAFKTRGGEGIDRVFKGNAGWGNDRKFKAHELP